MYNENNTMNNENNTMDNENNIKHALYLHNLLREYDKDKLCTDHNIEIEDKCIEHIDTHTDFYNTQYNSSWYKNITPLIYACIRGSERIANILINKGADIHLQCGGKYTAIHDAVNGNMYSMVAELIKRGADINIGNCDNRTPLITACMNDYPKIAALLIQSGADVHIQMNNKQTALSMALGANVDTAILLMENGADIIDTDVLYKLRNSESIVYHVYKHMYTQYNKSISAVVNGDHCFKQTYVPGLIDIICDFIL
ncbi:MAG: hypothetical protein Faunusvirus61_1 [Faunusvirus sp.]|jgi:ankyrin repeat protein|uniref:Uncharacterized protein n=1 Tax=Faunusvirus sp. TaxID=2487766 RepID=A0A3G4ZZY6_9VIRU|nr:MAG: hypothetical protein Faunusvirus61_1 [Faunusvirus sp.]